MELPSHRLLNGSSVEFAIGNVYLEMFLCTTLKKNLLFLNTSFFLTCVSAQLYHEVFVYFPLSVWYY